MPDKCIVTRTIHEVLALTNMLNILDKIEQLFGSPTTEKQNGEAIGGGCILHRVGLEFKCKKVVLLQVLFDWTLEQDDRWQNSLAIHALSGSPGCWN